MKKTILLLITTTLLGACTTTSPISRERRGPEKIMRSSWYGGGEKLARHTANGEVFRPHGKTAAHRSLPFGTRLRVCYNACTVVRINDRGPAAWTGRSLDISRGAAHAVGLYGVGVANVRVSHTTVHKDELYE